jgi:pSer/pThr/pTyr-binding forkhead associated (FHA) protein
MLSQGIPPVDSMPYLVFTTRQGQEIGRRRLDGPLLIGRSSECDVAIDDGAGQLSRRHCRVMPSPGGWVLCDLDSRNGTKYRGRRISSHVLRNADVFQIGLLNVIYRGGEMLTGEEEQPGVFRPRRPATPFDAADESTMAGFRYDPPPSAHRSVEDFPAPIPIDADLGWLDFPPVPKDDEDEA